MLDREGRDYIIELQYEFGGTGQPDHSFQYEEWVNSYLVARNQYLLAKRFNAQN